jgi:hypothetical protein
VEFNASGESNRRTSDLNTSLISSSVSWTAESSRVLEAFQVSVLLVPETKMQYSR